MFALKHVSFSIEQNRDEKRKAEEKTAAKVPAINIQAEKTVNKDASREGPRKKRRVRARPQVAPDSEHVSSPAPLNQPKPLEALADKEHGNVDASHAIEGHGDNEGGLYRLKTRPIPAHPSGRRLDTLEEPAPNVEASKLTDDFGKHFTPQQELSAKQAFWLRISNPTIESSLPPVRVEVPSKLPKKSESCEKCLNLDAKSSKSKQAYNDLLNKNDQIARIIGYGDYQLGNIVISRQMMKGFDIGIQEKKAKLFNEWERFTSNEGESIESYNHRFLKLMNDLKRNKHFPEKIASNLKFLNKLQPE
nr:hypothetical protein [Tanacetum cinerariifolium]